MKGSTFLAICALVAGTGGGALHANEPLPPSSKPQTEAERRAYSADDKSPEAVVNRFNQMAFFDGKPAEAMREFLADDFIERYPDLTKEGCTGTDKQCTIEFFETRGWNPGDALKDEIYKVIADEDHAMVFHKVIGGPEDRGTAYVDIFRVVDGKIVEHWAVGQPVSEKTSPRHPMF